MQESDLLVSLTAKLVLYISSIEMEGQRSSLWHGQREGSVSYATLQMTTIYFYRLLREGCWRNQILGSWGTPRSHQWPLPFFGNSFLVHSRTLGSCSNIGSVSHLLRKEDVFPKLVNFWSLDSESGLEASVVWITR